MKHTECLQSQSLFDPSSLLQTSIRSAENNTVCKPLHNCELTSSSFDCFLLSLLNKPVIADSEYISGSVVNVPQNSGSNGTRPDSHCSWYESADDSYMDNVFIIMTISCTGEICCFYCWLFQKVYLHFFDGQNAHELTFPVLICFTEDPLWLTVSHGVEFSNQIEGQV